MHDRTASGRRSFLPTAVPGEKAGLLLVLAVSLVLNLLFIGKEGYGNYYYSAAVKSMLLSFRNFFFASSDAVGFISVDKPPLGLWIQAAFAAVFGLNPFSIALSSALSGSLSVFLVYRIVRKPFGSAAAFAAALVLAITPAFVALSRNNTMDAILICFLLIASSQFLTGLETNRFGHIVSSVIVLGIGFNIKMAQAFVILPPLVLCYYLFFRASPSKKLLHTFAALAVLSAVSLSWAALVEMTPAEQRPYVGGTSGNSALELIAGYNGIERVMPVEKPPGTIGQRNFYSETGEPGPFRLFNRNMGGQAGWFIPPAVLGAIASLLCGLSVAPLTSSRKQQIVFWFLWFAFLYLYLSFNTGLFHIHYVAMIAPAAAALSGIGAAGLYACYRNGSGWSWLLPAAAAASAVVQILLARTFPDWNPLLPVLTVLISGASLLVLTVNILFRFRLKDGAVRATAAVWFCSLLILPAAWATTPILYGGDPAVPYARPDLKDFRESESDYLRVRNRDFSEYEKLIGFLEANRDGEEFLVGTDSSLSGGAALILATDGSVMCFGGFGGNVPALSPEDFRRYVESGKIRYVLAGPLSLHLKGCSDWIRSHGSIVLNVHWKNPGDLQGFTLYDCRPGKDPHTDMP